MEALNANFDLSTMFFVNALTCALSTLCFVAVARHQPHGPVRTSLAIWAGGNALLALGFVLLQLPYGSEGFPHLTLWANLTVDAGPAMGLVAANAFFGRPARENWPLGLALAIALAQIGYGLSTATHYDWVMMLLGCLTRGSMVLATARVLWRHADAEQRGPARMAAMFHLIWAGVLALRIMVLLDGDTGDAALEASSIMGLTARFMLTWVIAICLLWMIARQLNAQLIQHATRDPLTGLLNRRVIWEAGLARGNRAAAVILLDIDHFKAINDRWGHGVGDRMLAMVARQIAATVREDDLVGRIGGEEFLVLPAATGAEQVATLAERIRTAIAGATLSLDEGETLQCTVSIGHAQGRGGEGRWDRLVAQADAALYTAKRDGRNRVVADVTPEPRAAVHQNARVTPIAAAVRA